MNLHSSILELMIEGAIPDMSAYCNFMTNDDIYHALKEDILTLKLKPGQMISENEISRSYNVSRTPVKAAFLRLRAEKYIEIVPQKGSFITLLDIQYIRDIIYLRYVLESDIIKTVLNMESRDGLLTALNENLGEQKELIEHDSPNPKSFYEIDSRFHYALFEFAGRSKMWDIIQDFQVYYTRFRLLDTLTTARYNQLFQEHCRICGLLENGKSEDLKAEMYSHLHGNLKVLDQKIAGEYKDYFIQH